MARSRSRPPGRPASAEREGLEARATLIETAAGLFAEQGYEATSLRQVARGADVTPAMVAYYFRDKSGLLEAVVREGLEKLLDVVRSVVEEPGDAAFVPRLIRRYVATTIEAPWIPRIFIREVISRDTPLRTLFVEEFAVHAATLVPEKVLAEIEAGRIRSDLDPRFTIMSLLGICLFPFIAHPVLGPLLGYELNEEFGEAYARHAIDLMNRGVGAQR